MAAGRDQCGKKWDGKVAAHSGRDVTGVNPGDQAWDQVKSTEIIKIHGVTDPINSAIPAVVGQGVGDVDGSERGRTFNAALGRAAPA